MGGSRIAMTLSLSEQSVARRQTLADILQHPEWGWVEVIKRIKTGLRLTTTDLARLAGLSMRTVQDIERGQSEGSVKTMNKLLGILGLRLGVVAVDAQAYLPLLQSISKPWAITELPVPQQTPRALMKPAARPVRASKPELAPMQPLANQPPATLGLPEPTSIANKQ